MRYHMMLIALPWSKQGTLNCIAKSFAKRTEFDDSDPIRERLGLNVGGINSSLSLINGSFKS